MTIRLQLRSLPALLLVGIGLLASAAVAQDRANDPLAYDLRAALFPLFFQGGVSQSHVGSAARVQYDLHRRLAIYGAGRLPWLNVAGQTGPKSYSARAGFLFHLVDTLEQEALSGTVYPEDTPAIQGAAAAGSDHDLEVPLHSKLGGPRMTLGDVDRSLVAPMRNSHSLRLGYEFVCAVQRVRGLACDGTVCPLGEAVPPNAFFARNRFHGLHLGYAWSTHWNLEPELAGGKREVGWRRFYLDLTGTIEGLTDASPEYLDAAFVPIGGRIGMEGSIAALWDGLPGAGFGYSLELGLLPGESGLEGYIFLGLGLELDVITR